MSYILVLYFMGNTIVAFDMPDRDACADNAHKLAYVLHNRMKDGGPLQYQHQCFSQTPTMVELAIKLSDFTILPRF